MNDEARETKRFAITGASGLIGTSLSEFLRLKEQEVVPVVRSEEEARGEPAVYWNIERGEIDAEALEGFDVVVHLAGENIFGRWTEAKKRRIMESRRKGTELLTRTLVELEDPPEVFISMSGIDYYGDTGDERVDEETPPGEGFLAEVCQAWEGATQPAHESDIRTLNLRTGMVLSKEGGALATMLTPFKMGVGGRIGSGDQYMSWIAIEDYRRIIEHLVFHSELSGPVNVVAPNPIRNRDFTEILGDVLERPTVIPTPKFAVKLALGQMAEEMILSSHRIDPKRLREDGFSWEYPELQGALRASLT